MIKFTPAANKFALQASKTALVNLHSTFATLASDTLKIANDIKFLASGPNCGFGELKLPSNEPGSSIMPGKVNPTQCEMLAMVSVQILGNHQAILIGNSLGNFQLNTFMPMIIKNVLNSVNLMKDATKSFTKHCIKDLLINEKRIKSFVESSPMLITALNTKIGYDKCSEIVKYSQANEISLKQAASQLNYVTEENFDKWVDVNAMAKPF